MSVADGVNSENGMRSRRFSNARHTRGIIVVRLWELCLFAMPLRFSTSAENDG